MSLNSTGAISLGGSTTGQSIAVELGQSATAAISLNDSAVRALAGAATGAISMNDLRGKSSVVIPSITVAPLLTGSPLPGYALTSSIGTWSGTAPTYSYQWKRSGTNISGAISNTYSVSSSDVGYNITCTVTATNSSGSTSASSSNSGLFYNSTSVTLPNGVANIYLLGYGGAGTPAQYATGTSISPLEYYATTSYFPQGSPSPPDYPNTGYYYIDNSYYDGNGTYVFVFTIYRLYAWDVSTYQYMTAQATTGPSSSSSITSGGIQRDSVTYPGGVGGGASGTYYLRTPGTPTGYTVSTSLASGGNIYVGYFV